MKRLVYHLMMSVLVGLAVTTTADITTMAQNRKTTTTKARTSATVKKEQQSARDAIKKTNRQLEANRKKTQRTLNDLDLINAEMDRLTGDINVMQVKIDTLTATSRRLADTVDLLNHRLDMMKKMYAKSILATNSAQSSHLSRLAFIFASSSFTQAYRRMRYLREYSEWQSRQSGEIKAKKEALDGRRAELDSMLHVRTLTVDSMKRSQVSLDKRQKRADRLVKELKKENASLKRVLSDNEKRSRQLDSELDKIIAQERKKAAEEAKKKAAEEAARKKAAEEAARKKDRSAADSKEKPTEAKSGDVTKTIPTAEPTKETSPKKQSASDSSGVGGKFADYQGRLPFPATGTAHIVRGFGRQQHPQLPKVVINNSGIDIETSRGASAVAVFEGKVSAIFQQQGFNTIVMVRHGEYLTIYANLSRIKVKNGDILTQGQAIGTIALDANDQSRTTLHFEIRHEKEKLDPSIWLKSHK